MKVKVKDRSQAPKQWDYYFLHSQLFRHLVIMSSSDLPIRETILGILKVKDVLKEGKIHTSDFRTAVLDLGYHFGHPIIENILVHCVISTDGFVSYAGLEKQLIR